MSVTTLYDRRKSQRTRTFLSGVIRHSSKLSTMNCLIRNLSDDGARLEVTNSSWLPDKFELDVTNRGIRRTAKTAWRANGVAGVVFTREETLSEGLAREEVVRLRAEQDQLKRRVKDLSA